MERTNFALITALYANRARGLYSDIYFPIIKYAVVKIWEGAPEESSHYAMAEDVADKIKTLFGIHIPHVVIVMTLKKLEASPKSTIKLKVFEDKASFQILSEPFDEEDNTYEEKEREFKLQMNEIEEEFNVFLKREQVANEGVNFVDFISQNTENVLKCLNQEDDERLDAIYTSVIFFLQHLKRNNKALFKVADQLFWSSIIAAFLESTPPKVEYGDEGSKAEFYLDTSIALALLDLSTPEMELCAKEVCDIILSSGALLKIHPLTIEEMKTIMMSVENKGPYEGTAIASAWHRRGLDASKVAGIRVKLEQLITAKGVVIFPNAIADQRRQVMYDYKGKSAVRQLAALRSKCKSEENFYNDNFREVHDIYMDDYIRHQREARKGRNNIYFLTTNRDLKEFCHKVLHPNEDYMISTSKVIIDLWMHNTKPSDVSSGLLAATMAQCINGHRAKVREKLHEVVKRFKDNGEELSEDLYRDLLKNLYRRAKNVIEAVDANPDDGLDGYCRALVEANAKDNLAFDTSHSQLSTENSHLAEQVDNLKDEAMKKSQEIDGLQQKNENLNQRNEQLDKDNAKLEESLEEQRKMLHEMKGYVEEFRNAQIEAEKKNALYVHRDELEQEIAELEKKLKPMELGRKASFDNRLPNLMQVFSPLLMFSSMFAIVVRFDKEVTMRNIVYCVILFILGCICYAIGRYFNSPDKKNARRMAAYQKWESLPENAEYQILCDKLNALREELNACKALLKNMDLFNLVK